MGTDVIPNIEVYVNGKKVENFQKNFNKNLLL